MEGNWEKRKRKEKEGRKRNGKKLILCYIISINLLYYYDFSNLTIRKDIYCNLDWYHISFLISYLFYYSFHFLCYLMLSYHFISFVVSISYLKLSFLLFLFLSFLLLYFFHFLYNLILFYQLTNNREVSVHFIIIIGVVMEWKVVDENTRKQLDADAKYLLI